MVAFYISYLTFCSSRRRETPQALRGSVHAQRGSAKCMDTMRVRTIFAFILSFTLLPAWAADTAHEQLIRARSLKCTFGPGTVADWETGKPKLLSDNFGSGRTIHYDAIDIKNGRARTIGPSGAADLPVTVGAYGLTFTESFIGGISTTTVFSSYKKGTREFVAVLSRHVALMGPPIPSQYHGTCTVLQ